MAQAATMPPPLSPKDHPRRSGRRSATTHSFSKSPPPHQRPALSSHNSAIGGARKRPKQEDQDDSSLDTPQNTKNPSPVNASASTSNGRNKRTIKQKEKDKSPSPKSTSTGQPHQDEDQPPPDDEDQGITRCVCGNSEDDPDAGEFMVQCEICHVWQHGLCMGFKSEDQLDDDYYCEQCKPELHTALLNKLNRRTRHPSQTSHANPLSTNSRHSTTSRHSRSRSPVVSTKHTASKRRNTMNSRDAAFDESIKEVIEASAAEAAAITHDTPSNGNPVPDTEDGGEAPRKKRKRTDEDAPPKKRTRSSSSCSDQVTPAIVTAPPRDESPATSIKAAPVSAPVTNHKPVASGRRRGGARKQVTSVDSPAPADGEDVTPAPAPARRAGHGGRRAGAGARRGQARLDHSAGGHASEHSSRRGNAAGPSTNGTGGPSANIGISVAAGGESSRAYKNSHVYLVSQQPLYTSWNLPDYLAHLEHILPSATPKALDVCAGVLGSALTNTNGIVEIERTSERGVKVKWPSKRMSVGDMNKRVRALVDWVVREQANSLERCRRREALEKAMTLDEQMRPSSALPNGSGAMPNGVVTDAHHLSESPAQEKLLTEALTPTMPDGSNSIPHVATARMMEELMEELIQFQERFGPGSAKNRDRERR